jgi:Domain of unknown function (DUF4397)
VHKTHPSPVRRRIARTAAVSVSVLIGLGFTALAATPAAADDAVGYVRLAHLSPDTPNVDVYLDKTGDAAFKEQVFQHVGYGVMSKYLALPVGTYTIAMRKENDPPSTQPVITTQVTVDSGGAYTVAGVGRFASLGLRVLTDDLSRPTAGKAKVRIIEASIKAPTIDVSLPDGTVVGSNVPFASTTSYTVIDPGTWNLKFQPKPAGKASTLSATLKSGSVYSVLVLDGPNGLKLQVLDDASGSAAAPDGGVETGVGGEAKSVGRQSVMGTMLMVVAGVAVLAGLVVVGVRLRTVASKRT